MSALNAIVPKALAGHPGDGAAMGPAGAAHSDAESFAHLMARTLSPSPTAAQRLKAKAEGLASEAKSGDRPASAAKEHGSSNVPAGQSQANGVSAKHKEGTSSKDGSQTSPDKKKKAESSSPANPAGQQLAQMMTASLNPPSTKQPVPVKAAAKTNGQTKVSSDASAKATTGSAGKSQRQAVLQPTVGREMLKNSRMPKADAQSLAPQMEASDKSKAKPTAKVSPPGKKQIAENLAKNTISSKPASISPVSTDSTTKPPEPIVARQAVTTKAAQAEPGSSAKMVADHSRQPTPSPSQMSSPQGSQSPDFTAQGALTGASAGAGAGHDAASKSEGTQVVSAHLAAAAAAQQATPNVNQPSLVRKAGGLPSSNPPVIAGTAAAKQGLLMKKAAQIDKVAGKTEKVLPGNKGAASGEHNLPGASVQGQTASSVIAGAINASAASNNSAVTSASVNSIAAPAATVHPNTVAHLHDAVAINAIRLHETGATSLRVVIKPDAGTQLSLELRQHSNGVEAQAVLQNGNFGHLNHHWPELQQRLEQRGVRLAPLVSEQNFNGAGSGQNHFQHHPHQPGTEDSVSPRRWGGATVNPPTAGTATVAPRRPAAHQGWETWA